MKKKFAGIAIFVVALLMISDYFLDEDEFVIPNSVKLAAGILLVIYGIVYLMKLRGNKN